MKGTVLLVEDNPHIMEINAEVLSAKGYRVLQAEDGKTCMELLAMFFYCRCSRSVPWRLAGGRPGR